MIDGWEGSGDADSAFGSPPDPLRGKSQNKVLRIFPQISNRNQRNDCLVPMAIAVLCFEDNEGTEMISLAVSVTRPACGGTQQSLTMKKGKELPPTHKTGYDTSQNMALLKTSDRKSAFHEDGLSNNGATTSATLIAPSAPSEQELNAMQLTNMAISIASPSPHEVIGVSVDSANLPPAILPAVAVLENRSIEVEPVLIDYQRDYFYPTSSTEEQSSSYENDQGENSCESKAAPTSMASGIAGVVVGTLLLGTIPGCLTGLYAAYATRQEGAVGDIARALGEVALVTRTKAIKIDKKHNIVARSKKAMIEAWEQAKELDKEHHILQKVKEFSLLSWAVALDFARRNKLFERAVNCLLGQEDNRQAIKSSNGESTHTQLGTHYRRGSNWRSSGGYSEVAKTY